MDTTLCIEKVVGLGVKYSGVTEFNTEEEYNKLIWEDERPKPKWSELVAKWEEIKDIPEPKTIIELLQEKQQDLESRIEQLENKLLSAKKTSN